MTCTNCGKELSPEMKFCENCGTKVEQPIPSTPEINQVSEISTNEIAPQPPKKSKKGLVIGIIIVALIAVVAIAFPLLKTFSQKPLHQTRTILSLQKRLMPKTHWICW